MAADHSPKQVAASSRSDEPTSPLSSPLQVGSSGQVRSTPLRIAIIGGLTRATHEWERAGETFGVIVEHHDGRTQGHRAETLAAIVRRADIVVTITIPNSHNAVSIARRTATMHGRAYVQVKRLRPNGLGAIVADALALARTAELAR